MNRAAATVTSGVARLGSGERRRTPRFDRLLLGAAVLALVVTAVSFLARAAWLFELFTHFRLQLAAGAMLLLACAVVRRRLFAAVLAALAFAANGLPLLPWLPAAHASLAAGANGGTELRIMSANVYYRNFDYAALLEQVRAVDPDVLGLLEVDRDWLEGLSALEAVYPWRASYPQEGPWGLALYSKLPFEELPVSPYREAGFQTAILVELAAGDRPVELVLAHVSAPTTPAKARLRNRQFARLGELLRSGDATARILAGDLNTTPFSPYYEDLLASSNLGSAARGFGYQATWRAGLGPLGIPIDHCLVSDGLRVLSFRTGSAFGSDHLPIIVELAGADLREDGT
ncbi:MAG TPA: endonuclease/exonuclease/phosphatase family protein [Woeseiaceae bacterium]